LKYNYKRVGPKQIYISNLRDYTIKRLKKNIPEIIINGHPTKTKLNTVSCCLPGIDSRKFLNYLDKLGICVNVGSACSMGKRSRVLEAIGIPMELEKGAFRISLSEFNTISECRRVADILAMLYEKYRK
jgi:cysteine desulfurase